MNHETFFEEGGYLTHFIINDGRSLRTCIETYSKGKSTIVQIFFYKDRIIISVPSSKNDNVEINFTTIIFAKFIKNYYIKSIDDGTEDPICLTVQVGLTNFKNLISKANNDSITFIIKEDELDEKGNGMMRIIIQSGEYTCPLEPYFVMDKISRNHYISQNDYEVWKHGIVKTDIGEFCNVVGANKDKQSQYRIHFNVGYNLQIKCYDANNICKSSSFISGFSSTSSNNPNMPDKEYYTTVINNETMKVMSKLSTMIAKGTIVISSIENNYLCLIHSMGDFGENRIYIRGIMEE